MRELKERYEVIEKLPNDRIKLKHKFCGCEFETTKKVYDIGYYNCDKHFYLRDEYEANEIGIKFINKETNVKGNYKLKCGCIKVLRIHDLFRGLEDLICKEHE